MPAANEHLVSSLAANGHCLSLSLFFARLAGWLGSSFRLLGVVAPPYTRLRLGSKDTGAPLARHASEWMSALGSSERRDPMVCFFFSYGRDACGFSYGFEVRARERVEKEG